MQIVDRIRDTTHATGRQNGVPTVLRVLGFRMWLAERLFRMGAKVLGVGVEIETDNGVLPDQPHDLPVPSVRPTRGRRPF